MHKLEKLVWGSVYERFLEAGVVSTDLKPMFYTKLKLLILNVLRFALFQKAKTHAFQKIFVFYLGIKIHILISYGMQFE